MYRSLRIIRIIIALVCMLLPAWALLAGYDSVVKHMQILTALLSGSLLCLLVCAVAALALLGGAGYMEYYVQRHARLAAQSYAIMSLCLAGILVICLCLYRMGRKQTVTV